jgi:AcrR family transcriptional regulator
VARPRVGDERREQILTAFEACVVRKGLEATTLADVAEEAGQPRPLVRYFIGNRDEMITALIDRLLLRGEARMASALGDGAVTASEVATLLSERVFSDQVSNIVIMELWQQAIRDETLKVRLAAIYRRLVGEVSSRLAGADPGPPSSGAFDAAFAAVSLAFGAAFFTHLGLAANDPRGVSDRIESILGLNEARPSHAGPKEMS